MKTMRLAFWAFFTIAFLVFAVALIGQNGEPISVTFFSSTTNAYPKWLVLLLTALVGAVLASVFFIVELIILETRNVRLRRANQKLERALTATVGSGAAPSPTIVINPVAREEEV